MTQNADDPALFDLDAPTPTSAGAIETAAVATIKALRVHGALDATHTLKVELIRQGSRQLDLELARASAARSKGVTVAAIQLFSRVLDIADSLPTVQQAVEGAFAEIIADLAEVDDAAESVEVGADDA